MLSLSSAWAHGLSSARADLVLNTELMLKQSVWTSVLSAQLAAHHLAPGGTIVLTGALAAREGTPSMIGYGVAKAAVHQLTASLARAGSGLPAGSTALCICPVTLDTPMNRKYMPDADHSSWTPLETLTQCVVAGRGARGNRAAAAVRPRGAGWAAADAIGARGWGVFPPGGRRKILGWVEGVETPASGSLVEVVTTAGETRFTVA